MIYFPFFPLRPHLETEARVFSRNKADGYEECKNERERKQKLTEVVLFAFVFPNLVAPLSLSHTHTTAGAR